MNASHLAYAVLSACLVFAAPAWPAPKVATPAADARIPVRLAEAEAVLLREIAQPPVDLGALDRLADLRAEIADALAKTGETERAMDYLVASLELSPEQADRWQRLGDLALLDGRERQREVAEQAFRQVLILDPAHHGARTRLASLALKRKAYGEALVHLEIALGQEETGADWMRVATLTGLYVLTGQVARGRDYFSRMAMATGDDRFVIADAILLESSGDGKKAAKRLKEFQESPVTPDLLKQYAEALRGKFEPGLLDSLLKWLK